MSDQNTVVDSNSGEADPQANTAPTDMHRVKLYKLNEQGHWADKGTGHVGVQYLPVRNHLASA
jgi:hypothetical protein